MNVGEAAKASGISARMIRHYEKIGLIPQAERSGSGYRAYSAEDVHRLEFIRRARELGFGIAEISGLLALWNDRSRQSAEVRQLAIAHVAALHEKMESLRVMADTLQHLIELCAGDERPCCPILAGLEGESRKPI